MREQGLVLEGPDVPVRKGAAPIATSTPKTMEDALTPEVAHQNAMAVAMLRGSLQGVKRG